MAPVAGRKLLDRIIARVHAANHASARSRVEFELGAITLRLLAQARQGRAPSLDEACCEAHGCLFDKFRMRTMERTSALAWEFQKLIPDFDPEEARHAAVVKARHARGFGESGRAVFAWEETREAGPAKQESVSKLLAQTKRENAKRA
jgi:hypothetical protein